LIEVLRKRLAFHLNNALGLVLGHPLTCKLRTVYALDTLPRIMVNSIAPIGSSAQHDVVWVHGHEAAIPTGKWPLGRTPRALLRFVGPLQADWRRALKRQRLTVHFWCPPTGACVQMPRHYRGAAARLQALTFVVGGRDYDEALCQRLGTRGAVSSQRRARALAVDDAPDALPPDWHDIVCFRRSMVPQVRHALQTLGAVVLDGSSSKLRVRFAGDAALLRELPGVKLVTTPRLSTLLGSAASLRASIGALPVPPRAWQLDGAGEVVAVADTGLDSGDPRLSMHPDLSDRVRTLLALPMNPSWATLAALSNAVDDAADRGTGHGTHVAGLVCGSGAASGGALGGIAPAAELVFLAIEQEIQLRTGAPTNLRSGFQLSARPLDLRELYRSAAAHGAVIHNLSWGDASKGAYTDDCFETDLFLREDANAVVVCAVGNDGADRDGNRRSDAGSCYSPACAKNCLAVGATEGPLQGLGARAVWGDLDPAVQRWRATLDRNDPISGEPHRIAPISSAGPTLDGRIKPDLCAPGINLPSTRSRATGAQGWGLADPIPLYMYDGGTSMSAPVVAGALALIRQAWRRDAKRTPSGAALKALALLACTTVSARDGSLASVQEAGFGLLNVARALPPRLAALPGWRVTLRDAMSLKLDTGQQRDFPVSLRRPARLRAVLVWMDAAGERLINDLDLSLLSSDGEQLAWGGDGRALATQPDRCNTVECIDHPGLSAGRHVLRVQGHNVMDGPQRYALAWAIQEAQPP
jgi:serine protease AprX